MFGKFDGPRHHLIVRDDLVLWIIAAIFVIGGIVTLIRGAVLYGIVPIIIGLLIGPGGISIFC